MGGVAYSCTQSISPTANKILNEVSVLQFSGCRLLESDMREFKKQPQGPWKYEDIARIITTQIAERNLSQRTMKQLKGHAAVMNGGKPNQQAPAKTQQKAVAKAAAGGGGAGGPGAASGGNVAHSNSNNNRSNRDQKLQALERHDQASSSVQPLVNSRSY